MQITCYQPSPRHWPSCPQFRVGRQRTKVKSRLAGCQDWPPQYLVCISRSCGAGRCRHNSVSLFTSVLPMLIIFNAFLESHVRTSSQAQDLINCQIVLHLFYQSMEWDHAYFPTVLIQLVKNDTVVLSWVSIISSQVRIFLYMIHTYRFISYSSAEIPFVHFSIMQLIFFLTDL